MGQPHSPLWDLPFAQQLPNALAVEFAELPATRQWRARLKLQQREALLRLSGQHQHLRQSIVPGCTRLLWVYTWTTVGDAIMDLSARDQLPGPMRVDLAIAPHLAELFARDPRFTALHTQGYPGAEAYDFVLLQNLNTASIRLKAAHFAKLPFATMFGHLQGERFQRVAFARQRMAQLLGQPGCGNIGPPLLAWHPLPSGLQPCFTVAVALGGRDPRRRYTRWPEVLQLLVALWPAQVLPPCFLLLGSDNGLADLQGFAPAFLQRHCTVNVGRLRLGETAQALCDAQAFCGADGGLMHIALAFNKPGVALFAGIDPAWRLLPGAPLQALFTPRDINQLEGMAVAKQFLTNLPPRRTTLAAAIARTEPALAA